MQTRVTFSSLDSSDIRSVKASNISKLLLGKPSFESQITNSVTERKVLT